MAKTGRPKKSEGESGTAQIRVFADIAEMLSDLLLVIPKTTAQIVDPLLRIEVVGLHERYRPQIEKVKAARLAAEEAQRQAMIEAENWEDKTTGGKKKRG